MAQNIMKLDTSFLERMLLEIDKVNGNVKKTAESALKQAAVRVMNDTISATNPENYPAHGTFSRGDTRRSVIHFPKVEWEGNVASVPIGFDFSVSGAGGFLISGTPRMQPDKRLHAMYKQKKYMSTIHKLMQDVVWDDLIKIWEQG